MVQAVLFYQAITPDIGIEQFVGIVGRPLGNKIQPSSIGRNEWIIIGKVV
jgi:hypothetical protein